MAIDLGSPNLNQQPPNLSKWMQSTRRPPPPASQELWAFVEDTSSARSTVWPPRSYACTFCHREFRSAQALGGHMNVHRRDRAQLQQSPQQLGASSKASSPAVGFRLPESVPSGSFCIFQSAPAAGSPTGGFLAVWPYLGDGLVSAYQFMEPAGQDGNGKEYLRVSSIHDKDNNNGSVVEEELEEELDLELRLGRKSTHGFTFTQGMIYKTNG